MVSLLLSVLLEGVFANSIDPGPEVINFFDMLSSAEHEISNAHKYKNIKKLSIFQAQISL